ncbi:MAG: IS1595 family transposase [bacterium]|nr:IS1595 family transposase [bacterium]
MPDHEHRTAIPAVMNVGQFMARFGRHEDCLEHLRTLRWGSDLERFVCPDCGHARGWWLAKRQLVECRECHRQTSVTAGTVFHRRRSPLWKWFWAIYQLAQDKKGVAALELAKQVSVSYATAWLMLHKLRRAMFRRDERYVLEGLVEVDETYVGGKAEGAVGRGAGRKTVVAVALELRADGKPGHVAMRSIERPDGHCLRRFAQGKIKKGAHLRTDGWGAYKLLARVGYGHKAIVTGGGKFAAQTFPWLHTFIANMKRMILGTYHSVSPKHLDNYLSEFDYRTNRRWMEANLFDRLIRAALDSKAITNRELVAGVS